MRTPRGARLWVPPLGLALAATALMARHVLPVGFVGQDTYPIVLTSRVASLADLGRTLTHELMDGRYIADFYRPLFGLSIALDHAVWGLDPLGYQITSLLLFGAGGLVVFAVARRLIGNGATIGPLVATAAYLLHPSHIEVVPVPARRPDLLCWLFMGLALSRSGVVAAVAGFLAMMSKEAGLLIPALAVVAAILGSRRAGFLARLAEACRSTFGLWMALAVALLLRFVALGGLGGHGDAVRDATLDRIPNAMLAVWALLVAPQPVREAGVVGSPLVVAWTVLFVVTLALAASRPAARPSLRAAVSPFVWLVLLAGIYAVTGGIQAWYVLLPVACFSLILGAAAEAAVAIPRHGAISRAAATAMPAAIAILLLGQARYSPLVVRYDAWNEATRVSAEYFSDLASRVEAAAPGTTIASPPIPYWVPVRPGEPSVRGGSVLAPYSVQAWLELRYPARTIRVVRDAKDTPAAGEILVLADRFRPGFETGMR